MMFKVAYKYKKKISSINIFITVPSLNTLRERLLKRGTDKDEEIKKRIENASYEIAVSENWPYLIVNKDIESSVTQIEYIIKNH